MDGELGTAGESGIGAIIRLIVELFACMDGDLSHFEAGSASLDLPHAISMTQAGRCRLARLTQDQIRVSETPVPWRYNCGAMESRDRTQGHLHWLGM